jgi:predicted DNA-binding transcriptional regulator YafY
MSGTLETVADGSFPDSANLLVVDDSNPTARALRCLELLQEHPGITADRLAGRLGTSTRAARRYVAILREAGMPVESTRGPYGGYRLGTGLRLPPVMFSATEALGLVMAVLDGHHEVGDGTDPVGSAVGKIVRALPEPVADQVQAIRRTTAPAPDRGAVRPDPGTAIALVQACAKHRRVRIEYRSESNREWVMDVDPWAVVVRHGRWYLLCESQRKGREKRTAIRAYRVDRVQTVEQLDEWFEPPPNLDPVSMLEAHLAVGWEYDVEVVVHAPLETVSRCLSPALGRLESVDEATTRLVASTSNPYWYAEELAALPAAFRVVAGPELQHAVHALGERLLAATEP